MQKELEETIQRLTIEIKNLERLLKNKNNKYLSNRLNHKRISLKKNLIKYKKYLIKKEIFNKIKNKIIILQNKKSKQKILQK